MAINATIQVRRGLLKDFDPTKMLPGEWAVSIDASTSNQIVWMCFAPGVCKRMGTYEDFQNMVYNATGQIIERYEDAFGSILEEVNTNAEAVSANTDIVLVAKSDIINTYLPQIKSYVGNASASASEAKTYSENAKASASEADKSAEDAKKYSQNAFSTTPEGYEALVGDVDVLKNSIIQTTDRTLYGSKEGGIKLVGIGGASEQGENPSPDNPQEIESVGDLKNLLEVTATSQTVNGVEFVVNEDKTIDISGINQSTSQSEVSIVVKPNLVLPKGKFILSIGKDGGAVSAPYFFSYTLHRDSGNQRLTSRTPATIDNSNGDINSVTVTVNSAYTTELLEQRLYPMIRKASVENSEYKPYGYSLGIKASNEDGTISKSITIPLNEPLRKGDEITVVDGVWGIDRRAKVRVIDGTNVVKNDGTDNSNYLYYLRTSDSSMDGVKKLTTVGFCESLSHRAVNELHTLGDDGFNTDQSENTIYINLSSYVVENTVSAMRAYLAQNPIAVQYELATPTFEPFTDQTPFYGLESFDTVTYISTDSEIEPSIELKFAKTEGDAVTLLNYNGWNLARLENEALRNAVLSLGGNV